MSNRRGESTFSIESFIRIALSVTVAVVMLGVLLLVWNATLSSETFYDESAYNVLESFVDLVHAQQESGVSTNTFLYVPYEYFIIGFGAQQESATHPAAQEVVSTSPWADPFEKPGRCEGSCACLYRDDEDGRSLVGCEDLGVETIQLLAGGTESDLFLEDVARTRGVVTRLYTLSGVDGAALIEPMNVGAQASAVVEGSCNPYTTCCGAIDAAAEKCLGNTYVGNDAWVEGGGPGGGERCVHEGGGVCSLDFVAGMT